MGIGDGDWRSRWRLEMEIGDVDLRWIPKLRLGDGDWRWRWRLEIRDWRLEIEIGVGDLRW